MECKFKDYGDEEKLCTVCRYVIPNRKGENDEDVVSNMVKNGCEEPDCRKNKNKLK